MGECIANISEGGLAVQAAMALVEDSFPCIRFQLGPARYRVQTGARVTLGGATSKKSAGLQFLRICRKKLARKSSEYISLAAGASNEYSHSQGDFHERRYHRRFRQLANLGYDAAATCVTGHTAARVAVCGRRNADGLFHGYCALGGSGPLYG